VTSPRQRKRAVIKKSLRNKEPHCLKCNKVIVKDAGEWVHKTTGLFRCFPDAEGSTKKLWVASYKEES
jgi:hypothetical protein